jgi:quinol-cytochrome oxidoreductase complex cytochrome b subunit
VYDATQSYSSVYKITYLTPLGFILRQIHLWSAYMMIFASLTHFFAKFILGSYKRRGGGALWLLGVFLGFLVDIPKEITPLTRFSVPPDYAVPYIGTPQAVGP